MLRKILKVRSPDSMSTGSIDSRLARDEVEAYRVVSQEKERRKIGRREQKAEADRQKITLPRLKFLEK